MSRSSWETRIARAGELAAVHASARDVLCFYGEIARVQSALCLRLKVAPRALGDELVGCEFPEFVRASLPHARAQLREEGENVLAAGLETWHRLLIAEDTFFARAFLQPWAEANYREPRAENNGLAEFCPCCGRAPQASALREESHGARRTLVCSLCQFEWPFSRILCPSCGEDRAERLPVYQADQFPAMRAEACDTCHAYLLCADLTKDGRAVPEVDCLAALAFHLRVRESGYQARQASLMGV